MTRLTFLEEQMQGDADSHESHIRSIEGISCRFLYDVVDVLLL
jgi:hypothetical protein